MTKDKQNIKTTDWLTRGIPKEQLEREKREAIREAEAELHNKQIEEMARVLCGMASSCDKCMFKKTNCYEYQEAKALYEADFQKQEWISVEERLPDVLQEVFVYRGNHIGNLMNVYTYVGGDMWQDELGFGCRQVDEGITHWMPLPEPPKMKGE